MVSDYQILCGDCLSILPTLPRATMVFADPPDNIGLKYENGQSDAVAEEEYKWRLDAWLHACRDAAPVVWFSVNARWQKTAWLALDTYVQDVRLILWYFTFGQHRETDCGNNYRPLFRIAPPDYKWRPDRIRIPSERQRLGDKRANPNGRVPGDVWGGPADIQGFCRVQGNNRERRRWHPTQHPEALVERAVLMSTDPGDLIIDPFMGTGTTLRVCQRLDRRCVTIDLSETYCQKVSEETGVLMEANGDK